MHLIYVAVNEISGKAYVGQTGQLLAKRQYQHEYDAKRSSHHGAFHHALRKYGASSFVWFELESGEGVDWANAREAFFIDQLGSLAPSGYNLESYGRNKTIHESTRRKMSVARLGQIPWNKGQPQTLEVKQKLSAKNKGRKLSPERCERISETSKGRTLSIDVRARIAASQPRRRDVVLRNSVTREIRVFMSQNDAARQLKVSQTQVSRVLLGKRRAAAGWELLQ